MLIADSDADHVLALETILRVTILDEDIELL